METDERSICTHVPQPQPSGVSHEPHDPEASPAQEASVRAIGKKTFGPFSPSQDVNWLLIAGPTCRRFVFRVFGSSMRSMHFRFQEVETGKSSTLL